MSILFQKYFWEINMVNNRLKEYREKAGLSQTELAWRAKMAGQNISAIERGTLAPWPRAKKARTPMSKQGRPVLRYCAWTSVIPMLRFNPDFRAWAKQRRERPVHANPLGGREIVGAALNRLLRLSFALVKNQTFYRSPQLVQVTG